MAPGVELVAVAADRYTLRSEFDAFELSGDAASDFARSVLTALAEPLSLDAILARAPSYSATSVGRQLDTLVRHGLVVECDADDDAGAVPFAAYLQAVGRDPADTARRLAAATVGIFGLEAHGAHLARMLAQLGVGTIRLVDPFRFEAAHLGLGPGFERGAVGLARQVAVGRLLAPLGGQREPGPDPLDADAVREVVAGCELVFGCWDQGYAVASHWLNRAAHDGGVPALFGELRATATLAGPLFLPGRSACWMCYRMRGVACARDFEQAMAFEEHLDRARRPLLASRPLLPFLPEQLATAMALEALRLLLGLHPPTLVDSVAEHDAMTGATTLHPVLAVPDCPVCAKKKARVQPPLDELIARAHPPVDLAALAPRLVDASTGVVAQLAAVPRDPSEAPLPLVWRARVANHRFLAGHDEERATCSGKGMTREQAWASCLGEAVERYSGACWTAEELHTARRGELEGRSLDPRELVLYAPEQYEQLPYAPYHDAARLAWMRARSLVHGDEVWVPALAALMDYPVASPEEFLCPITSNGLAGGPTPHEAVLGALCEVLERDALLVSWCHRLPGRPHDASRHPDAAVRELAALYGRRGVELALIELTTDHPVAVFMAITFQRDGDGPSAVVGLGADLEPATAARKAALEVGQVRPSVRRRARALAATRVAELAADPTLVASMDDHALLYTSPSTVGAFDFLFGEPREWRDSPRTDTAAALRRLVEHFRTVGGDVLYVDLTPSDMASLGLYTARVIVPGFVPLWFGHHEVRRGGRRLFEVAHRLGLRPTVATAADLNPMPHPIA
jgi:ribosomal protein S12 methylthiotransferase accessory factor